MDLRLAGRRALVTGSSAGLGEAIAKCLAAEGAVVVVHGRNIGRTNAVTQAIDAAGGRAEIAIGDLSTDGGADIVTSAAQAGGGIDILVNNAGAYHHLTWMEATPDRWVDTYQLNVPNDVGRLGRPEEVAAAVAYLVSCHADYVSGTVRRVDGGAIRSVN